MDNPFDEIRSAVARARELNRAVDGQVATLAELLRGRLRHAPGYLLVALKKELRRFNAHTRRWRA